MSGQHNTIKATIYGAFETINIDKIELKETTLGLFLTDYSDSCLGSLLYPIFIKIN